MNVTVNNKTKVDTHDVYSIPEYHVSKEVGGVFLGHRDFDTEYRLPKDISHMILVPNAEIGKDYWRFKNRWALIKATFKHIKLKDITNDFGLVGEWHTHPNGKMRLSKQDIETIKLRVQKYGSWAVGIVVPKKGGNRCEMLIQLFTKSKTVTNANKAVN